jgi:hypothetical protein
VFPFFKIGKDLVDIDFAISVYGAVRDVGVNQASKSLNGGRSIYREFRGLNSQDSLAIQAGLNRHALRLAATLEASLHPFDGSGPPSSSSPAGPEPSLLKAASSHQVSAGPAKKQMTLDQLGVSRSKQPQKAAPSPPDVPAVSTSSALPPRRLLLKSVPNTTYVWKPATSGDNLTDLCGLFDRIDPKNPTLGSARECPDTWVFGTPLSLIRPNFRYWLFAASTKPTSHLTFAGKSRIICGACTGRRCLKKSGFLQTVSPLTLRLFSLYLIPSAGTELMIDNLCKIAGNFIRKAGPEGESINIKRTKDGGAKQRVEKERMTKENGGKVPANAPGEAWSCTVMTIWGIPLFTVGYLPILSFGPF